MLEILHDFESAIDGAGRLSPAILFGPGLVCLIAGLFVWLGGLGFRKLLVAVAGASTGAIFGFFAIGQNIISALFMATLIAVIAPIFERLFIAMLAATLAAMLAFVILVGPYINNSPQSNVISPVEVSARGQTISVRESAETMKAHIVVMTTKIKRAGLQMPVYDWAIIAVSVLISIVVGFWLRHLASALCCSILGTVLVFAGMILLLLHKGAVPVSRICSRPSFYTTVFIVMTVFGTLEQLLLCRYPKTSSTEKKQEAKHKQEPGQTKKSWLTT